MPACGPVVVLAIPAVEDEAEAHAIVAPLVHGVELAGPGDLVLEVADANLGYPALVQAGVAAGVLLEHLGRRRGHITPSALDGALKVYRASLGLPVDLRGVRRGRPLTGPSDFRWGFAQQAASALLPWTMAGWAIVTARAEESGVDRSSDADHAVSPRPRHQSEVVVRLSDFRPGRLRRVGAPGDSTLIPEVLPLAAAPVPSRTQQIVMEGMRRAVQSVLIKSTYPGKLRVVRTRDGIAMFCMPVRGDKKPPRLSARDARGRSLKVGWVKNEGQPTFLSSPILPLRGKRVTFVLAFDGREFSIDIVP
jgi:hypothetical protein